DAKTTQPTSMDCAEGRAANLPCNHSTIGGNEYIHWYRQIHSQGPQYVIHGLKNNETNEMASLIIAEDRKSSTLILPHATDTAVYFCAVSDTVPGSAGRAEHKLPET
uniref:T cell receptor alpha variable 26-1 n=1 Tax=Cebus imitator TaxID=2715852 RepID=A0A2K5S5C8_CEBIM